MITDNQYRRLMKLINKEKSLEAAADKAGMDVKTARKWRDKGKTPTQAKQPHNWRTRPDPFEQDREGIWKMLEATEGQLEAKTIFEYLQRECPGRYQDGQLRTLQRQIKTWKAEEGPAKEAYFPQEHKPGFLSQSDFTSMNKLKVTIAGEPFPHLAYHYTLSYSNWEAGTVCFSESYESLSEGFQNAVWKCGAVSEEHRTDCMSAAVLKPTKNKEFQEDYQGLLNYYGVKARAINPASPNENGDVEKRNDTFKNAVNQYLLLRGSRDFKNRKAYDRFLGQIFDQQNAGRQKRLTEELAVMRRLPERRLDDCKESWPQVRKSSTIRVGHNTYSVPSRLIGEKVQVKLYAQVIQVWYAQKKVQEMARLRGAEKARIDYRHIIDSLVRKPGAFENYKYREELFPSSSFRMAYDALKGADQLRASRQYLKLLHLAAWESQEKVQNILSTKLRKGEEIRVEEIEKLVKEPTPIESVTEVCINAVNLSSYDQLLSEEVWA